MTVVPVSHLLFLMLSIFWIDNESVSGACRWRRRVIRIGRRIDHDVSILLRVPGVIDIIGVAIRRAVNPDR
jgi:hypothetical protein